MPKNNAKYYYQDGGKRRKFSQRGGIGIWSNPYEGISGSDLNAQLWQEYHQRGGNWKGTPYCLKSGRKNCMLKHIHEFKKSVNNRRNLLNTLLRSYDAKKRQRGSTFKQRGGLVSAVLKSYLGAKKRQQKGGGWAKNLS